MAAVGTKALDFELVTLGEEGPEVVKLSDHIGKKNILLLFVPMAFTGGCTKEFCEVTATLDRYTELGAMVFGISGDNPFANAEWAKKEGIGLTLLSDYEHRAADAYGVAYDTFLPEKNLIMGGVPKRSAFVIDKEGVIRYREVHDVPSVQPDFEAIQKCLAELV